MADTLGTAAPSQLLILMAFPVVGAALLAAYLGFFFYRRNQKSAMKHGLAPAPADLDGLSDDNGLAVTKITDTPPQPHYHPSAFPDQTGPPAVDDLGLRLDLLDKVKNEAAMKTIPSLPSHNKTSRAVEPDHPTQPVELLRLLRDPQSGHLIVDVGGQRYHKLAEVTDKKIGQFLLKVASQFLAFTNGMIISDSGVKTVPVPSVGQAPEPIIVPLAQLAQHVGPSSAPEPAPAKAASPADAPPLVPPPPPEAEAAFLASLQVKPAKTDSQPSVSRGGLFGRSAPAPAPILLPVLNLAKEINTIVQARLTYSPLAQTSRVEVISAMDGGIRINVNGTFYETPDEITDPEVKTLIKESIKQWERS
jgi:hypothetical protein